MKIIKDNRRIKYLYHYTKNENVNKILESEKITSRDQYIFFTDSYNKSVSLFEEEMDSNNYYYDLDCTLKRRTFANPDDYKIIKIPYYNDGKFVSFKFNNKKNIYTKSVIHDGEISFSKDMVEVLDIPSYKNYKSIIKNSLLSKLISFILLMIPLKANADTWLDDESYRDVSWFDESTYENTDTYRINTAAKLAGLLYEVNIKGYTFEGKTIEVYGPSSGMYCTSKTCRLDATAHEWVPLKSSFKGVFDTRQSATDFRCGYHRIVLASLNKKIEFLENKSCTKYVAGDRVDEDLKETVTEDVCSIPIYNVYYSIHTNESNQARIEVEEKSLPNESQTISIYPKYGYLVDSVSIKTKDGQSLSDIEPWSSTSYLFTMPPEEVYIDVSVKRKEITIPTIDYSVKDKEYCKMLNGSINKIGSEVACGSESFIIVNSNGKEVKMLAKYNLDVGTTVHKEKIVKENGDSRTDGEYCRDLAESNNGQVGVTIDDGYCYYLTHASNDHVLQNKNAKSSQEDENGNYLYPQVGDVYPTLGGNIPIDFLPFNNDSISGFVNNEKYNDKFFDFIPKLSQPYNNITGSTSPISNELGSSLLLYLNELKRQGIEVKEISLLTLDDLNSIAKQRGNSIPYDKWYENGKKLNDSNYGKKLTFGKLKDYISEEDSWLYDRSYWLRTGYAYENNYYPGLLFVNSAGEVCGGSSVAAMTPGCQMLIRVVIGSGVRPTITIPTNELKYLIKTKTDGNGTIEVVDNSLGGEEIKFKITAEKEYVLGSLLIKTDSGEEVEFSKGEFIENSDGTISIDKNKFTMPFENVTIIANWTKEIDEKNPNTGDMIVMLVIALVLSLSVILYGNHKRKFKI